MLWRKAILFALCLLPLSWAVLSAASGTLGPDPGKTLVLFAGVWALRFLLLTLLVSIFKRWTGIGEVLRYRRMLGLYAFFYASIHLAAVLTYLLGWSGQIFLEEFSERPYMALGILAWFIMLPLVVTSNNWMVRRLKKRWRQLHRLVYVAGVLACAHFIWLVRSDYAEALIYMALLTLLLAERIVVSIRKRATMPMNDTRSA